MRPLPFYCALGPLSVGTGLIADRLQLGNTVLQRQVGEIGDAIFNGIVEPLEFGVCLGRPLAQFSDMRRLAPGTLLPAVKNRGQDFLKVARLQQAVLDVIGHKRVELFHRHGAALAAGLEHQ